LDSYLLDLPTYPTQTGGQGQGLVRPTYPVTPQRGRPTQVTQPTQPTQVINLPTYPTHSGREGVSRVCVYRRINQ
jgi:hypothetical protein